MGQKSYSFVFDVDGRNRLSEPQSNDEPNDGLHDDKRIEKHNF